MAARPGEQESGDGWGAWWHPAGLTLTIVDGLGHGPEAAEARDAALRSVAGRVPCRAARAAHQDGPPAVRRPGSSGRSGSAGPRQARLLRRRQHRRPAGQRRRPHGLVSGMGTLGLASVSAARRDVPWGPGASSSRTPTASGPPGISSRYPGSTGHDPAIMAALIWRDAVTRTDDPPSSWLYPGRGRASMNDDPVLSPPGFRRGRMPATLARSWPVPCPRPGEWTLSRWRVTAPRAPRAPARNSPAP